MDQISGNGIKAVSDNENQSTNGDVIPTSIFHWKCYQGYLRTFPAMIKLCELLCIFIAFIISFLDKNFLSVGGSWLTVTTALSFIVTAFFLVFHLFLLHRFIAAPWCLIELAAYVIVCILVFSNGVLSAAYSHLSGIIIAETIFTFVALAIYTVDSLVAFKIFTAGRYYD
ncbi:unnamed protein product [Schistosoma margrebowiei]|uniref:MARVEL domain-containing protein n=1 Tax=Schistosoma margrebowiei TaxID=48269 RepID=A0AA84Z6I3_9TREM|nr:unnamed protein product [Schistosoma margrebowiei]